MSDTTGQPGWTGGQYSAYRALLGLYLAWHFAALLPWGGEVFSDRGVLPDGRYSPLLRLFPNPFLLADGPAAVTVVLCAGVLAALALAAGWRDRVAALAAWFALAALLGRNPLIANPSLPYVGLLLLLHAGTPRAPYGSLEARGRVDPAGSWFLPRDLWRVAWILMAAGYGYSGLTKLASPSWRDGSAVERVLANPLARDGGLPQLLLGLPEEGLRILTWGALAFELGFVALALVRPLRALAWTAMLGMHLGLILWIDFADLSLGMVLLHLFTFDPRWVPPRRAAKSEHVFYDGECGLCHRMVRFCLAEDAEGRAFRFAPLQGSTLASLVPAEARETLPDSIVVRTADGRLLVRSAAVAHVLRGLGGLHALAGMALSALPALLRDGGYDAVAHVRKRLFERPSELCPMLPRHLGARFDP